HVHLREMRVGLRVVLPRVAASALLALERRQRDRLRDREHRVEIEREVPAGVELAVALDVAALLAIPKVPAPDERRLELALRADDAYVGLHALLKLMVERVRVLGATAVEAGEEGATGLLDLGLVHLGHRREAKRVLGRVQARAPAKDHQIRERV